MVVGALWATGCGPATPSDEDLGALVRAPDTTPRPIDVERAAVDPDELARALAMPHRQVGAALGAHRFAGTSSIEVTEDGAEVEAHADETTIALTEDGDYHARSMSAKEYGREVYYVGGVMYLRPGFGPYHRRPPADDQEPARVRDEMFATLGAWFELLAPGAELVDRGAARIAGRDAREIQVRAAPQARPAPSQPQGPRQWRERAVVRAVSGTVWLCADSGAPLQGELEGAVRFSREGRTFEMALAATHHVTDVGADPEVTAPPAEETVATPERSRELHERDALLEGIAPPARRAATPDHPAGTPR
jgi:hypothetical protein